MSVKNSHENKRLRRIDRLKTKEHKLDRVSGKNTTSADLHVKMYNGVPYQVTNPVTNQNLW